MPLKRISLLYFGGFLASILLGGVVSVAYHYSWWYLILLAFPISFGWPVLSEIFRRIDDKNLKNVSILTVVLFFCMMGLLVLAAYYGVNEMSLWGMVYAGGIISYILGLTLIGLGLPKRWEEKKKREGIFPYWIKNRHRIDADFFWNCLGLFE